MSSSVRNRSKELVELLGDVDKIRSERRKAKANKHKYTGVGNDGMSFSSGGGRYGGFGSESFYSGGGGGGSSSYSSGDRGKYVLDEYWALSRTFCRLRPLRRRWEQRIRGL